MKLVELPDAIADLLLNIAPTERAEFLRKHGFRLDDEKKEGKPMPVDFQSEVLLFTDGASRGNPGEAGIGFVIRDTHGKVLYAGTKYLGITTNNVAEWNGLLVGLRKVRELGISKVRCFLDSELVVKQMKGEYKVKHPEMKALHAEAEAESSIAASSADLAEDAKR